MSGYLNNNEKLEDQTSVNLVLVVDENEQVCYSSDEFIQNLGYDQDSLFSLTLDDLFHQDMPKHPCGTLRAAINDGKPWMGILMLSRANSDEVVWLEASVLPVMESGQMVEAHFVFCVPAVDVITRTKAIYGSYATGNPTILTEKKINLVDRIVISCYFPVLLLGGFLSFQFDSYMPIMLAPLAGVYHVGFQDTTFSY